MLTLLRLAPAGLSAPSCMLTVLNSPVQMSLQAALCLVRESAHEFDQGGVVSALRQLGNMQDESVPPERLRGDEAGLQALDFMLCEPCCMHETVLACAQCGHARARSGVQDIKTIKLL